MLGNRRIWLALSLLMVAMLLVACGGAQVEKVGEPTQAPPTEAPTKAPEPTKAPAATEAPAETQAPAEAPSGEPVKIGAVMPLSAPGSVTGGKAMQAAFEIAAEEINAAGGVLGRPLQLIMEDTEGLPERGAAVMEKLINQDQVVAVVGEYHSSVGLAEMEVAHDNHIPIVFAETWNDKITASRYPEVFRVAPLSSEVAQLDTDFIASLGVKKVVIMTENTDYGIPAAEKTTEKLKDRGIEAVTFSADPGTQDFSSIIERIKASNPDLILVLLTGETSYNFEQQAAEAGIGPQDVAMICNQVAADSESFWKNVPDGNFCFYRQVGLPPVLWTDKTKAFAAKYTAKTGEATPPSYAMEAYDSLWVMVTAINNAGSTDPDAIIDALENIEYEGALGTITFPVNSKNPPEKAGKEDKWWHQFPDFAAVFIQYQQKGQMSSDAPVVFPDKFKTADPILP